MGGKRTYKVDPDPEYIQYALPSEEEAYRMVCEHGSIDKAAKALGKSYDAVRGKVRRMKARAARKGYMPEHGSNVPLPDSMRARGLTVQGRPDGSVIQYWLKGWNEHSDRVMAWAEALERAGEKFKSKIPKVPPPSKRLDKDLLALYAIGDPHYGMHAWHKEAGGDWDLKIAKQTHFKGLQMLAADAPRAEEALVLWAGDNSHVDDSKSRTPTHGHPLDTDSRWSKILDDLIETNVQAVRMLLQQHKRVRVVVLAGNHDPQTSTALRIVLKFAFANEPRVTVDDDRHMYTHYTFGDCFFGFHHGHGVPLNEFPLLCSLKWPKSWGNASWRRLYTGHRHKQATISVQGIPVDVLETLACTDEWADSSGYIASRGIICDLWHKKEGLLGRNWKYIRHINQEIEK